MYTNTEHSLSFGARLQVYKFNTICMVCCDYGIYFLTITNNICMFMNENLWNTATI